eukprot:CFRG8269T1
MKFASRLLLIAFACLLIAGWLLSRCELFQFNNNVWGLPQVKNAASSAAEYILRVQHENGMFNYVQSVHLRSGHKLGELYTPVTQPLGEEQKSYNELRHCGAGYALVDFSEHLRTLKKKEDYESRDETQYKYIEAAKKSAEWVVRNLIKPVNGKGFEGTSAVYSYKNNKRAKLGGTGLALILMARIESAEPGSIPTRVMKSMANFIVAMQSAEGQFYSFYLNDTGPNHTPRRSLYYPGEAMLGLMYFYKMFPDPLYLDACTKGILSLARERANVRLRDIPIDHWLMIAVREWVVAYRKSIGFSLAIEKEVMDSIVRVVNALLCEMPVDVRTNMGSSGIATRMEGLQATMFYLPDLTGDTCTPYATMVQKVITSCVSLLIGSQITHHNNEWLDGGWLDPVMKILDLSPQETQSVRIDYPQHALSALVRNWQLAEGNKLSCVSRTSDDQFQVLLEEHHKLCKGDVLTQMNKLNS